MNVMFLFLLVCFAHLHLTFSNPPPRFFTHDYDEGPIRMTSNTDLYYSIFKTSNLARFGVVLRHQTPHDLTTGIWLGLGISERTSGGMKGADIVTCEFAVPSNQTCKINDRFVPFRAFPVVSAAGKPELYPFLDKCGSQDWTFVSSIHSETFTAFEVERPLNHSNLYDRPILPGVQSVLVAHGGMVNDSIQFHGFDPNARGLKKIVLIGNKRHTHEEYEDRPGGIWPNDTHFTMDVIQKGFPIPSRRVSYLQHSSGIACSATRVRLVRGFTNAMIIGAEPIINVMQDDAGARRYGHTNNGGQGKTHQENLNRMVKYVSAFVCSSEDYAAKILQSSGDCSRKIFGPLGNPASGCTTFIYAYTNDPDHNSMKRMVMPNDVGILIDSRRKYIVLETVYYNPDDISDAFDFSGIRLYLTRTVRQKIAGSLIIGDPFVSRAPGRVIDGYGYEHTCPFPCTQDMSEPKIELFSIYSSMHMTGRSMHTNLYDKGRKFKDTLVQIDFWSDWITGQEGSDSFDAPKILERGDQITVTCKYDTSHLRNTEFGIWATDEVCIQFIHYYPLTYDTVTGHELNLCSYQALEEGSIYGTSICADNGRLREFLYYPKRFKFVINPLFKDYIGVNHKFAGSPNITDDCSSEQEELGDRNNETDNIALSPQPELDGRGKDGKGKKGEGKEKKDKDEDEKDDEDDSKDSDDVNTPSSTVEPGIVSSSSASKACFPAQATVTVRAPNGAVYVKNMEQVEIGDDLLVSKGKFSPVFMFSHRLGDIQARFVRLHTGNSSLTASSGHMLYVVTRNKKQIVSAGDVRIGDRLRGLNGDQIVNLIEAIGDRGLFNPHTAHGDIVVDGKIVTTFTEAVGMESANGLLAPIRAMFWVSGETLRGRVAEMVEGMVSYLREGWLQSYLTLPKGYLTGN